MYASFSPHIIIIEQHCSGEKRTTQFVLEYTMCVFKKNTPSFHSHSHFYIYEIVLIHMVYGVWCICAVLLSVEDQRIECFCSWYEYKHEKGIYNIHLADILYIYIYRWFDRTAVNGELDRFRFAQWYASHSQTIYNAVVSAVVVLSAEYIQPYSAIFNCERLFIMPVCPTIGTFSCIYTINGAALYISGNHLSATPMLKKW